MKGRHNKKSVRVEFVMSEAEAELVKERMAELGITNLSAYLRKMAVDGYIIHLDMGDIQEMIRLLRICSNNLNQWVMRIFWKKPTPLPLISIPYPFRSKIWSQK